MVRSSVLVCLKGGEAGEVVDAVEVFDKCQIPDEVRDLLDRGQGNWDAAI